MKLAYSFQMKDSYRKLLICDLLGTDGQPSGGYTIAVDAVDAGAGEVVLIIDEGNGARQIVQQDPAPIRAVVVGIVDEILVDGGGISLMRGMAPIMVSTMST